MEKLYEGIKLGTEIVTAVCDVVLLFIGLLYAILFWPFMIVVICIVLYFVVKGTIAAVNYYLLDKKDGYNSFYNYYLDYIL